MFKNRHAKIFLLFFLVSFILLSVPIFSYAKSDVICSGSFDSSITYELESSGRTYLASQDTPGNLSLPYIETPYSYYEYDLSHFVSPESTSDKYNIQSVSFHFEVSDLLIPNDEVLNFRMTYRYDAGRPARLDLTGFKNNDFGSVTLNFLGGQSKTMSLSKFYVKELNVVQEGSDYVFTIDMNVSVPTDEILTSFYVDMPKVYLNEPINVNVPSYVVGLAITRAELFQYTESEAIGQDKEFIEDKIDSFVGDVNEITGELDGFKPSISDIESQTNMFNIVDFTVFNSYGNLFSVFMEYEIIRSCLIVIFMFMTISYVLFGKKG